MRLRKRVVAGIIGFFILFTTGCDIVPSAEEAAEANTDRGKFQAPKGVVTTAGDSQVLVQWPQYPNAGAYTLYWSNQEGLSKSNAKSQPVADTLFLHEKLTNGIPYYYAISATTDTGESNLSQVISATPDFKALPAVDAVTDGVDKSDQYVIFEGEQRNTLYWAPVAGATSYSVYWSNAATAEVGLNDKRIDFIQSPFVHDNLDNGTAYHYVVVANNFEKPGLLPAVKTGTPFKPAPTAPSGIGLVYAPGTNPADAQLTLKYSDVSNAETFTVYWKTSPGVTSSDQRIERIQPPFIHTPLNPNTVYYYRLMAINAGGDSALSGEFRVDTGTQVDTPPIKGSPPNAPKAPGIDPGNQQLTLNWDATDPNALGYNIYWSTNPSGATPTDTKIANVKPPYTHIGLANGVLVSYIITAINDQGESVATAQKTQTPNIIKPGIPSNVTAAAADGRVAISWASVSGATDYNVYWRLTDAPADQATKINNVLSPHLHENLENGVSVTFHVSANNPAAEGGLSQPVSATPQIPRPLAPSKINASAGNAQVRLSWEHQDPDNLQQVSGYRIYWAGNPGPTPNTANVVDVGLNTTYLHDSLVNGRLYYYVITALNAGGESTLSAEVQALPQVDLPGAPTGVSAQPGNTEVTINWASNTAQKYNLYWWTNDSSLPQTDKTVVANVLTGHVVDGLNNGSAYHFYVAALNIAGESVFSKEVIATPQVPPPAQTTATFESTAGDTEIQLFWEPIASATSYRMYWSTTANINPNDTPFFTISVTNSVANSVTKPVTNKAADIATSFTHTGLSNGNTYYYAISGVNAGGEGPLSNLASATPQVPAPAVPPSNFSVAGGDGEVIITWDTTALTGVDSYNVYWSITADALPTQWIKIPGFVSGASHRQLSNGVTYYYQITAVNAGGESPLSIPLSAMPQVAPPSAPSGLTASVITATQVSLNWYQGKDLRYNLYRATTRNVPLSGAGVTKITNAQAIVMDSGLAQGTPYYYVLTAQNAGGESTPSPVVRVTPDVIRPNAPNNLSAAAGDALTIVTWQNIADPQATYTLYWTDNPSIGAQLGTQFTNANAIPDVRSPYQQAPLTNGSRYYYVVTATDTSGVEGPTSGVASATPQVAPVGPPSGMTVTAGEGQIIINWDTSGYVNNNANNNAPRFNLYWTVQPNTPPMSDNLIPDVTPPYTHFGLSADTLFTYAVTAVNAAGESAPTPVLSATAGAPVNTAPIIADGTVTNGARETTVTLSEDNAPVPFDLLLNAYDNEGDTLTWRIGQQPSVTGATASIPTVSGNGVRINYTPALNYSGPDRFSVIVSDSRGGSDVITISINVDPINDLPTFTSQPSSLDAFEGLMYSYAITISDVETPAASLTLSPLNLPIWMTLQTTVAGEAILSGTPGLGDLGSTGNRVTLSVADTSGGITEQTFVLNVATGVAVTSPANSSAQVSNQIAGQDSVIAIQAVDENGINRTAGGDFVSVSITGTNQNTDGTPLTLNPTDNGDGTYTATYTPTIVGTDTIAIAIGGTTIGGSPYASQISPAVASPTQTIAIVPSNSTSGNRTLIPVHVNDTWGNRTTGTVLGSITSGFNRGAAFKTEALPDGTYVVSYIPKLVGDDPISITVNGAAINASPFISVVQPGIGMASKSIITPLAAGIAGQPTVIEVVVRDTNTNLTGNGNTVTLTGTDSQGSVITIPDATYANGAANAVNDGKYTTTYTPTVAGLDTITATVNTVVVPVNAIRTVAAGPASAIGSLVVTPAPTGTAGTQTTIVVQINDEFGNITTGTLQGAVISTANPATNPNNNSATFSSVLDTTTGQYNVRYTPLKSGTDPIHITLGGAEIKGSPFNSVVVAGVGVASTSIITPLGAGVAGQPTVIEVVVRDINDNLTGAGNTVTLTGTDSQGGVMTIPDATYANSAANGVDDGKYTTTYTPTVAGLDTITATVNTVMVPINATRTVAAGPASAIGSLVVTPALKGVAGTQTTIVVQVNDEFGNITTGTLQASVAPNANPATDPNNTGATFSSIVDTATGQYIVSYTPIVVGTDPIHITLGGAEIVGSPFNSVVSPGGVVAGATVVTPTDPPAGSQTLITLTVLDAQGQPSVGGDVIAVTHIATSANASVPFDAPQYSTANQNYTVTYTPLVPGVDLFNVNINGAFIEQSPGVPTTFTHNVIPGGVSANSTITFAPASAGTAGQLTTVDINIVNINNLPTQGGDNITISGTDNNAAALTLAPVTYVGGTLGLPNGVYRTTYTPLVAGTDTLTVKVNLDPAPVTATRTVNPGAADAPASTATVPAGIAGTPTVAVIQIKDAQGNNTTVPIAQVKGVTNAASNNPNVTLQVAANPDGSGTLLATYTPIAVGSDTLILSLNGANIGGVSYPSAVSPGGVAAGATVVTATDPPAGSQALITITVLDAQGQPSVGGDVITVTHIAGSTNANVPFDVPQYSVANQNYTVAYTPLVQGLDSFNVNINDAFIELSPGVPATFTHNVIPGGLATKSTVSTPIPNGVVGSPTTLTITVRDAQGNLSTGGDNVSVGFVAGSVNATVAFEPTVDNANGTYSATYTPLIPGMDTLLLPGKDVFEISVNGPTQFIPLPAGMIEFSSLVSPGGLASLSTVTTQPPNSVTLPAGTAGQQTTITVTVRDTLGIPTAGGDLVEFTGLDNNKTPIVIPPAAYAGGVRDGIYTTSYIPTIAGTDEITIQVNGTPITIPVIGAPATNLFTSLVNPGTATAANSNVLAPVPVTGVAGTLTKILVELKDQWNNLTTGNINGNITANANPNTNPNNSGAGFTPIPNPDGTYTVSYMPIVVGTDPIHITLSIAGSNVEITGSPFNSVIAPAPVLIADALLNIPDPVLSSCISSAAAANVPALQLTRELLVLTCIPADPTVDPKIIALTGIDQFANLQQLDLSSNAIVDLSPLSGLSALTLVALQNNQINTLTPLSLLPVLASLDARANLINDPGMVSLNTVASFPTLESLWLDANSALSDLLPLSAHTTLLSVRVNNTAVSNLAPLATLPNLTELAANGNGIDNTGLSSFALIANFPVIQTVSLDNNAIDDVSDLATGLAGKPITLLSLINNPLGMSTTKTGGSIDLLSSIGVPAAPTGFPSIDLSSSPTQSCVQLTSLINYYAADPNPNPSNPKLRPVTANAPTDCTNLPTSPVTITTLAGDAQITIDWAAVTNASQYTVEFSDTPLFTTPQVAGTVLAPTVQYVHNTGLVNGTAVSYRVIAQNNIGDSAPSSVVSATPVAVPTANRAPVIQEGAMVAITMDEDNAPLAFNLPLTAVDADGDSLLWRVSPTAGASNGAASVAATGVNANVLYTPTLNSNGTDAFVIEVDDNRGGVDSIQVNVTIRPINDAPLLVNNKLTVIEGQIVALKSTDLNATDIDSVNANLIFSVSSMINGTFDLASNPGVAITSFTQAAISAGDVRFVHTIGQATPSYRVSVSDGALSNAGGPMAATIAFTLSNQSPIITSVTPTTTQNILVGESVIFASQATDREDDAANIPLSYVWTFPPISGITDILSANPGAVVFNNAGSFSITLTVNDSQNSTTQAFVNVNVKQPLSIPVGLNAISGDSQVTLSWTPVASLTYEVHRGAISSFVTSGTTLINTTAPSASGYNDTAAANSNLYYYRIIAVNGAVKSAPTASVLGAPVAATAPPPPTLSVIGQNNGVIQLNLSSTVTPVTYKVYFNTTGNVTKADTNIYSGSATTYSHSLLTTNKLYYYRASAVAGGKEGLLSAEQVTFPFSVKTNWTKSYPTHPVGGIQDVIYTGQQYVAIGRNNLTVTSPDAMTWTSRSTGTSTTQFNRSLAHDGNGVVMMATRSGIYKSLDHGITWNLDPRSNSPNFNTINSATRVYGIFNVLSTSPDSPTTPVSTFVAFIRNYKFTTIDGGNTWAYQKMSRRLFSIPIHDGSNYYVMDPEGIEQSSDGISWSVVKSANLDINLAPIEQFDFITYAQNILYVGASDPGIGNNNSHAYSCSTIATSFTCSTIWGVTIKSGLRSVAYSPTLNAYFRTTFGSIRKSVTGTDYGTSIRFDLGYPRPESGIKWIERGVNSHLMTYGGLGTMASSTDGVAWTRNTPNGEVRHVIWNGTQFVAVGSEFSATSKNGVNWVVSTQNYILNHVDYDGSVYTAVGRANSVSIIVTSTDAITWSPETFQTIPTLSDLNLNASNASGSIRVAAGYGAQVYAYTTVSGLWVPATIDPALPATNQFWSLAWNGVAFLAVSNETPAKAYRSTDGVNWTVTYSSDTTLQRGIAVKDGVFYLAALFKSITSPDGLVWTEAAANISANYIYWDGTQFWSWSNGYTKNNVSPDAIHWNTVSTGIDLIGTIVNSPTATLYYSRGTSGGIYR